MANILDLINPTALNMLLQPQQMAGAPNMLTARPEPHNYPIAPVQAPMAAPQPQMAQAAPQQAASFLSPDRKQFLQDMFLGWAAGATPQQSLAVGAAQAIRGRGERSSQNETVKWLQSKGMDEQGARMLAGNPKALGDYLQQLNAPRDPMQALQVEKTQLEINKLRQGRPETYNTLTAEEKKALGLDPNKAYQRAADNKISEIGGNGVSVNVEAPKLPSGYRFIDTANPNAGVEPIPGGPATQLPGELAARIGLADRWIKEDYPTIKRDVTAGNVTGPMDLTAARNNKGAGAEAYRKLQSGVEVLSRLLSGAGMTQIEVDEKAARYQPSYLDDAQGMASKLEQLKAEIEATRDAALAGRGGPIRNASPDTQSDPLGIR